ncbi:MAG: carbohydrate binding family 9 domain-containing protein, partial [Bacteroidetes bacterium]|nr:carbohydrate binding family 9 domain-containing protein [Bacteroidota bacterium]
MTKYIVTFFIILFFSKIYSQTKTGMTYEVHISQTNEKIEIDGKLNEDLWKIAEKAKDFYQVFPADTSFAKTKTEVMLAYDDKYLYVGAICYDGQPGDYVIQSLKRDFSYPVSDAFVMIVDPFEDKTNGFAFSINPYGVQREGLVANGGNFGVTTDWDNLWYSEVTRTPEAWYVEMAIPFKTLRFKDGIKQWGINFGRNDLKRNESSTWFPVPRIFNIATLNFTGKLLWDKAPKKPSLNMSLIPYAS